jgi:cobalt-zinc-cadmium efflux system outer membrane protein
LIRLIPALLASGLPLAHGGDSISFAEAISRALQKNPSMAVYNAETRIAEAKVISAFARENPELLTEIEDFAGSGDYDGFQSAIYNVGISQLIVTGKKRHLRAAVAEAEGEETRLQYEAARRELIAETGKRYVTVLAYQNIEANAAEDLRIATEAYTTIKKQIDNGRGSALDSGQAKLGQNEAKLARENAKRETGLARQQLSAMWGEAKPHFTYVDGQLETPARSLPSLETLNATICDHPAVAMANAGVEAAGRQLTLEQKKKIPDLTLGLGYRRDSAVDDNAMVLGFSLPFPLFNKNEGGIAEANAAIEKRKALVARAESQIEMQIASAHARVEAARSEYDLVAGEMLGAAAEHYRSTSEAFHLGRVKYLELLEARRSLNAVKRQKAESLTKYHSARIDLESLTGTKL